MERVRSPRYVFCMMETTSHSFVRRARLSTAAIALAVCVTVAAVAAVFYAAGDNRLANNYKLDSPISSTEASPH